MSEGDSPQQVKPLRVLGARLWRAGHGALMPTNEDSIFGRMNERFLAYDTVTHRRFRRTFDPALVVWYIQRQFMP